MIVFKRADASMKPELIKAMALCFEEPLDTVRFFFENKANPDHCYVCIKKNKPVSLLHALPTKLKLQNEIFSAAYIYGACTVPECRGHGYMKNLLRFSQESCLQEGYDYCVLVPENCELEHFYEKLGYQNFFKTKTITLSAKEMPNGKNSEEIINNSSNCYISMEKLRTNIYNKINGILYNRKELHYASTLYGKFGGKTLLTQNGYAICSPEPFGTVTVRDFTCRANGEYPLLCKIHHEFQGYDKYIIKTFSQNKFFENMGKISFYGMIKPLTYKAKKQQDAVKNKEAPYLGLALD